MAPAGVQAADGALLATAAGSTSRFDLATGERSWDTELPDCAPRPIPGADRVTGTIGCVDPGEGLRLPTVDADNGRAATGRQVPVDTAWGADYEYQWLGEVLLAHESDGDFDSKTFAPDLVGYVSG